MSNYHLKYRPNELDQVIGQPHAVSALEHYKKTNDWPHAFLFTGGSGCGKTTLARIIAHELAVDGSGLVEIDAATFNSVDVMRSLIDGLQYANFGTSAKKFIILDECHMLSKAAWNALLKSIEEPPSHVYFALCTTDEDKVPDTIKTRCTCLRLKSVPFSDLVDLLSAIAEFEQLPIPQDGLDLIAREALGSPRQALTSLNLCGHATTIEEVKIALETADQNADTIELCRMLSGNVTPSWKRAVALLKRMTDLNPESIRLVVVNYTSKALLNTTGETQAIKLLAVLEAFSKPCNPSEKMAPILLAVGQLLLASD